GRLFIIGFGGLHVKTSHEAKEVVINRDKTFNSIDEEDVLVGKHIMNGLRQRDGSNDQLVNNNLSFYYSLGDDVE
ncbi:hypothetical protein KI387_006723, partial [Taxus chinensis]